MPKSDVLPGDIRVDDDIMRSGGTEGGGTSLVFIQFEYKRHFVAFLLMIIFISFTHTLHTKATRIHTQHTTHTKATRSAATSKLSLQLSALLSYLYLYRLGNYDTMTILQRMTSS